MEMDFKEELSLNFADTNMRSLVRRAFRWNSQTGLLESAECTKIGTGQSEGLEIGGALSAS